MFWVSNSMAKYKDSDCQSETKSCVMWLDENTLRTTGHGSLGGPDAEDGVPFGILCSSLSIQTTCIRHHHGPLQTWSTTDMKTFVFTNDQK